MPHLKEAIDNRDLGAFLLEVKSEVDARLAESFPQGWEGDSLENSAKAMRHMLFLGDGGKRVRSAVALASCVACGGRARDALVFAQAVEEIHSYTLMVDDIVDDDDFRRGSPTTHTVYGANTTIMASARLYERGLEPFHRLPERHMPRIREALDLLHRGQSADLDTPVWKDEDRTLENLQFIQAGKTSGLFQMALLGGAHAAGGTQEQIEALWEYGYLLGLTFQARDDILSASSTAAEIGKPTAGEGADEGKFTFVAFQPDMAAAEAETLKLAAGGKAALDKVFGPEAGLLRALIDFAAQRRK
jgi:geranylgeranyl pyrophosphate synthase